jgi:membrane-associated phospholipid phosphatase
MNEEVLLISKDMHEDKKAMALFWDDFPDGKTLTGGGHWASILKTLLNDMNLSLIEGAKLYAGLFITINDAAIGCFKAKYTYNQIRPVTYIRKYMDLPEWNSLIITPPHPEYPAAHAAISMAAATALTKMLGENISFTDNTYAYRGYKAHHFNSIRDAALEAGISRLYGGIHYSKSIEAGYAQGEKIAENINHKLAFQY